MLDLARGQTPRRVREEYAAVYRGAARRGLHGASASSTISGSRRRTPRPRRRADAGIELVAALRRVRARRHRPLPAGRRSPRTCASSRSCARPASASASPPTPSAPARATGSRSSAATPRSTSCRCTCTRTSSRARSRSASPSTALRPIELLADCGCLGPRTTVVHATHADGHELDLLARGRRAHLRLPDDRGEPRRRLPAGRAGAAPQASAICIGSDSNVRIDPFEELRELDGIARRQSGRRDVFTVDALLAIGSDEGAASLGLEHWPAIEIDASHPQLRGVDDPRCRARPQLLGRRRQGRWTSSPARRISASLNGRRSTR